MYSCDLRAPGLIQFISKPVIIYISLPVKFYVYKTCPWNKLRHLDQTKVKVL